MRSRRAGFALLLAAAGWIAAADSARAISCTISTVGVSFGNYDVFRTTPTDSTGSVTYTCTNIKNPDRITIDLSKGNASTFNPRQMRKSAESLNYNLFMDASYTQIWGDNTSGTTHVNIKPVPTGTFTIFGRIPVGNDVSAGSYTDTVIATINF